MSLTTPAAVSDPPSPAVTAETGTPFLPLAGLLIIAVLPALFWTSAIALFAQLAGTALSPKALTLAAIAITVFLGCIVAALRAAAPESDAD